MEGNSNRQESSEVTKLVERLAGNKPEGKQAQESDFIEVQETKPLQLVLATPPYRSKIDSKRMQQAWDLQLKQQQEQKEKEKMDRAIFLEELKKKKQERLITANKIKNLEPDKLVEIGTKGEKADPIEIEDD